MSELKGYGKLYGIASLFCVAYEVIVDKDLSATWSLLIILNIYVAAICLQDNLKNKQE